MKKILLSAVAILFATLQLRAQVVVANFSANPTVLCPGQTVQFQDLSTGNPTMWNWTFPGGTPATSTLQNPSVVYNSPGQYNVSLSASNGGLPGVNTTFNYITVNSTPPSPGTITGPSQVCAGQPAMFSVSQVSNALSYSWTAGTATIVSGQGTRSVTLLFAAGTTTVCVSSGNACGYGAQSCTVVTVLSAPNVSVIPSSNTVCMGSAVSLTATGAFSYTWSPAAGLSNTTGAVVNASPSVNTVYTVTGSSALGCTRSATASVFVNPSPAVTVAPTSTIICLGSAATLTASGALSYTWTPATGLSTVSGATVSASPSVNTTYTVTGTGNNGCTGRALTTVSVTTLPPGSVVVIAGPPVACAGLTGNFTVSPVQNASTYSWSAPPASSIVSGQGTNSVTILFGGQQGNVCVQPGNGCGYGAPSCIPIIPLAAPVLTVVPATSAICEGDSVSITAAGASSYTWSPPSGLSATNGSAVAASPSASTIYTVTGTSSSGCRGSSQATVTVLSRPVVAVTPNAPSICGNGTVNLTASGAASYTWSPASGLSSTTGATVTASPPVSTNYSVTGTATNGCSASASVAVTVTNSAPSAPSVPAGAQLLCSGGSYTYSIPLTPNASTYSWSVPSAGTITSGQGGTLITTTMATGNGSICVAAINACGSSPSSCKTVTVNPSPSVTASPATSSVCAGNFIVLQANGASTYTWAPAGSVSSPTMQSVVAGPMSTTVYTVTGTSANGCSAQATATENVMPVPSLSVTPSTTTIYQGNSVTLNVSGASSYTWTPVTGLSSSGGSTVSASPSSDITYTVTGTDNNGCSSNAAVAITVNTAAPAPPLSVDGPTLMCEASTAIYSVATVPSASGYSWTTTPGFTIQWGQGNDIISVLNGGPSGTICTAALNGCGSSAPVCLSVTGSTLPVLSVTGSTAICNGTSATLSVSGATTYTWEPSGGLSTTTGATTTASPTITTTYTITGASVDGCMAGSTHTINVNYAPAYLPISGPDRACTDMPTTYSVPLFPGLTYTWSASPPPAVFSTTSGNITQLTLKYPLDITVSYSNSCGMRSSSKLLGTRQSPILSLNAPDGMTITCTNPFITLRASTAGNPFYTWTGSNGYTTTGAEVVLISGATYTVRETDVLTGCVGTTTIEVADKTQRPAFIASVVPTQCESGNVADGKIFIPVFDPGLRYELQAGTFTGSPTYSSLPLILPNVAIRGLKPVGKDELYVLRVINSAGCYADTVLKNTKNPCVDVLFIPDAFTPDGDGNNDAFVITGAPPGDNSLRVYNRWGSEVYSGSNYSNDWMATSGGTKLPPGTYYYVFEVKGSSPVTKTGFIVIQY